MIDVGCVRGHVVLLMENCSYCAMHLAQHSVGIDRNSQKIAILCPCSYIIYELWNVVIWVCRFLQISRQIYVLLPVLF